MGCSEGVYGVFLGRFRECLEGIQAVGGVSGVFKMYFEGQKWLRMS
jgi:hypothetical protein